MHFLDRFDDQYPPSTSDYHITSQLRAEMEASTGGSKPRPALGLRKDRLLAAEKGSVGRSSRACGTSSVICLGSSISVVLVVVMV